jgi:hypothetical protein
MAEDVKVHGIVLLQAWTAHRNGQLPTAVETLAAATPNPGRAEVAIEALAGADGPLVLRDGRVDLANVDEADRRRHVRAVALSAGVPEEALPADLSRRDPAQTSAW